MTKKAIISKLESTKHNKVKVAIVDIDGVLRGKIMSKDKFISALTSGFGFCSVVFGWDMVDEAYDNVKVTGWHTGYGDIDATLALETFRTIPWENEMPFMLADFSQESQGNRAVCPRSLLKDVIQQAKEMDFTPFFSQEFEWFNYRESSTDLYNKDFKNLDPITHGMFGYSILKMAENSSFFNDLFDLLEQFKIPLEGLHTETGQGVTEAAIVYTEILESADRAALFKTAVKEISFKHGIIPSFMAKQTSQLPGCSGHIHQSLWRGGKNAFHDANSTNKMSAVMKSYIAGQLLCLPEILPMFAPTINSYKRLVEGAWAPTTITWGIDNRTTALRILTPSEKATRIEHRVVGSDVNPYLAMAASLASGLYGIKNKLKLDVPETKDNGYKNLSNGVLPSSLLNASQKMKTSTVANELFGSGFVDHFTNTRIWECRKFATEVTDWETKRYFEVI